MFALSQLAIGEMNIPSSGGDAYENNHTVKYQYVSEKKIGLYLQAKVGKEK